MLYQNWIESSISPCLIKNLGELHDLYMETDTLLLADVFQNYRQVIMKNYGLDPTHFYTAPSLSWSAGLKFPSTFSHVWTLLKC